MRILAIDSALPFPPVTGAQSRTFHLLKSLSAEHELTLACFHPDSDGTRPASPFPLEVKSVPFELPQLYKEMRSREWEAAYRQLSHTDSQPWFVSYYDSPAMELLLQDTNVASFDLILIEHSFMARFLPFLPRDVPKILDMHNVHTLMAQRYAKTNPSDSNCVIEWERTRRFERMVCEACQLCLCCSEREASAAHELLNITHTQIILNGVDTEAMTPGSDRVTPGHLLFTGTMNYAPNVDAVRYFVTEILPLIEARVPGVTFHIAGSKPTSEVEALASDKVFIHPSVPDMREYFLQACVVVVPLRTGGGTRLKILDAAACGKAIVSTSLGAEGLNLENGKNLLLADSAAEFACAVIMLLENERRREELSRAARYAAEEYDWAKIGSRFRGVVRKFAHAAAQR